jgi:hypothetical protein
MTDKMGEKTPVIFICKKCDFITSNKKDYARHLLTRKHTNTDKKLTFTDKQNPKKPLMPFACECGNIYKHRQSLFNHKKKCNNKPDDTEILEISSNEISTVDPPNTVILELLKQNQEFKELIIEQNKQIVELAGKVGNTINNTTNNTTNNNTNNFNMQFFLNEQCKDALNIMDFINQLQLKLTDLDMVGRLGYSEGISKIFIRGLKELDIFKRPVHCSDLKRETLYVKDKDAWEKDNEEKKKMKTAIKYIAAKNFKQINDWKEENPESEDIDTKKHMEYHTIIINAVGGSTDEEDEKNYNKIIRNVAKEVVIDKSSTE